MPVLRKLGSIAQRNRPVLLTSVKRALAIETTTITQQTKVERPYLESILPSTTSNDRRFVLPRPRYGGRQVITMISGDGVSHEIMEHVRDVYGALSAPVDFDEVKLRSDSSEEEVKEAILAVQRNGVAIKGNVKTIPGKKSINLMIRKNLGLFAYVQRCYNFPGVETRHKDVDIVVVRENTEGEYSQLEHQSVPGVVESMKIITREKCARIAHFAFNYALQHGRKKVTAVHKANIMKLSDGLFLRTCEEVSKFYSTIEFNSIIIDNCCMQLVSRPQQFDVMVLPNLYGNIVGNLAAGLVGGAGLAAGMNLGEDFAIFETGTRKNVANPVAMLLASADLLDHLGLFEKSNTLRNAIVDTISKKNIRTEDIGGTHSTKDVVESIISNILAHSK